MGQPVDEIIKYQMEAKKIDCPPLSSVCEQLIDLLLKKRPMLISGLFLLAAICVYVSNPNSWALGLLTAAFGTMFVALTYKLNQATYHKNLYEQRFQIYKVVDDVMCEWAREGKANRDMIVRLNDIMRPSYFIFSDKTYQFIKNFRFSIITLAYMLPMPHGVTEDSRQVTTAKNFMASLIDNENLPKNFPELKIGNY